MASGSSGTQAFEAQGGSEIGRFRERQQTLHASGIKVAMADMTREEIDAKLALVEARTETRFVELSSKLDRVLDSNNNLKVIVTQELDSVHKEISDARAEQKDARAAEKDGRAEIKRDNSYTRVTIIVTVVASLIAAVTLIVATQGNMLSALQAGLAAIKK